jgi:hypothetical protein
MRRPARAGVVAVVAVVVTALAGPASGAAAGTPVAYPAPGPVPPVTATTLQARYAATGQAGPGGAGHRRRLR